ncbi:MAG: hypothetical protein EOM08_13360 [Clostridia bacterium]|nr:hypothetical protein [Clostridia bacterium]NCC77411.1 hypothetical protein [Clostridia bacterium]
MKKKSLEARFGQIENGQATVSQSTITTGPIKLPKSLQIFSDNPAEPVTIVLGSDRLGEGDPALGLELLKSFLLALDEQPKPPEALILYNSAVLLTQQDSSVYKILQDLQKKRTEILVCSMSLQHYCPNDPLNVGEIRTMSMLVERMMTAHHILWPK